MTIKQYLLPIVLGTAMVGTLGGLIINDEVKAKRFQNAKSIEAKVIDKAFIPGNGLAGRNADTYTIAVQLPNGEKKVFEYEGEEARKISALYGKSDSISFKEGFKPGFVPTNNKLF